MNEPTRLFLLTGGRRDSKKYMLLVSPRYNNVRELSGQESPPSSGEEARKQGGKNSTSQLCIRIAMF